ncbi:hypothetical protein F5876DRAFT_81130 [Lentinula aff. lateritia]|uniref:Uncharacterized protein n=1 Tax=Lentinula aff. lateritia TaxID=2804960 RepID=A0ACC1TMT8_9AGAR|nr:hypothetical protein F5876DRAFT_81130 [Lentinula aff. lateritia]
MLIAVLLHTFVGTVAGTPQGPIIISCRGPNDHSAKYSNLVTYAGAKALELGKCINGPSGASHPRLPALLNLPSPASGPATSSSTSLTYTHSQPGFIPIHTPPLLSRAIPNPAPSTFQKLYHAADFDSLTSCKSVAPLSEESEGSIVLTDEPFSMALSSTGSSGDAQASSSGASGASGVIGSDGITMDDGHKPVQPSAMAFYGDFPPYSEESQEAIFFILLPIYFGNFDIDRRNRFKFLKKNRSNLFVQNTAIPFASVKVSHRASLSTQARRQEKGHFEDRRTCVAPAMVCRRFVVRVTPNCYHRSQIRVILKISTHKRSGSLSWGDCF